MKTIIKASCQDQNLRLVDEPIIASGGVHENFIQFEFCEKWAGMTKTAVFYNDAKKITAYYEVVDSSNMCEVPCEVTEKKGTMYFGVFGVLGETTRTSEVVAYKINQGAITTELVPSEPSPDIWEQLLAHCSELLTIVEGSKQEQEQFMTAMTNDQNLFKAEMRGAQETFESTVTIEQEAFKSEMRDDQEQFKQDTQDIIDTIPGFVDIKTSTGTELKTSAGPLNFISMEGATEQKTLSGKNLVDFSSPTGINGVSNVVLDKNTGQLSCTYNGAFTNAYYDISHLAGRTVTYTHESTSNTNSSAATHVQVIIDNIDGTTTYVGMLQLVNYTIPTEFKRVLLQLFGNNTATSQSGTLTIVKPMLRLASITDATYEPYIGGVEMLLGYYNASSGFVSSSGSVCNKAPIPCKTGDVIKIDIETNRNIRIFYYLNGTYVNNVMQDGLNTLSATVPSGVDSFNFYLTGGENSATLETVGKINLTVNGKPIRVNNGLYDGGATSPSPYMPQSIHNVGDCVEMIVGSYAGGTGIYGYDTTKICNKNPIPCKSGDVVKIEIENTVSAMHLYYYNKSGYIGYLSGSANSNSHSFTIPSGATYFNFRIDNSTVDTVGKILLTINGMYVVQIVESGKNLLQNKAGTTTSNGVTFTVNDDGSVIANGTASGTSYVTLVTKMPLTKGKKYIFNGCPSGGTTTTYSSIITIYETSTKTIYDRGSSVEYTCEEDNVTYTYQVAVFNGTTVSNLTFYPMLRYSDITDDTYEPYKETVATVLLNAPLCDTDVMDRTKVVRKRATKKASELSWGASTNNPHLFVTASFTSDCICTHFTDVKDSRINGDYYANMYLASGQCSKRHGTVDRVYFKLDSVSTLEEWKAWIAENDFLIEFDLPEEVIEALDEASQLALQSFEAFDTATHITIDSRVQPNEIKFEHGTTKVGAMALAHDKVIHEKADKYCIELPEGTDFNDVFDAGKYYVSYKPNFENKPLKNISGYLDVIARKMATGVYYQQIFTTEDKGVTLRRYYIKAASVWSAWTVLNDRVTEYRFLADGGVKNLFDNNWYPGGMYLVTISRPALAFRQVSIVFCDQDNNIHEHELVLYRGDAGKLDFFYDWDMDMVSIRPVDYGDGGLHDVYVSVLTLSRGDMNTLVYAESEE